MILLYYYISISWYSGITILAYNDITLDPR